MSPTSAPSTSDDSEAVSDGSAGAATSAITASVVVGVVVLVVAGMVILRRRRLPASVMPDAMPEDSVVEEELAFHAPVHRVNPLFAADADDDLAYSGPPSN